MSNPSAIRKYYVVNTMLDASGALVPAVDISDWTARYLSDDVVLVRDPNGEKTFPVLGVDVTLENAMASLPVELPLSMSQADADAVCIMHGLAVVDIAILQTDRVGGK